jgi:hypothetical protein
MNRRSDARAQRTAIAGGIPLRWTDVVAVAAVLAAYLLPVTGHAPMANPNELVRVELAVALGVEGTVALDGVASVYGVSEDVAVRDGVMLADKAPGLSMAAAPVASAVTRLAAEPATGLPPYWPLRHLLTALFAAFPAVLLIGLVAWWEAPRDGLPMLVLVAFTTPLWPYATLLFGHVAAAMLIGVGWWLLLGPIATAFVPTWRAVAGGAAIGLAISTEYPTAVLGAVMVAGFATRRPGIRSLISVCVGVILALTPTLVYHTVAFGSPWTTGYAFKADPGFASIHGAGVAGIGLPTLEGVWGILFGLQRGLIAYSPWLALATVGVVRRIRSQRSDGWALAIGLLASVAVTSGFADWTAGWCSASRHLLPALPLFVIAAIEGVRALDDVRWGPAAVGALIGASAVRTWATVAVTPLMPPEFPDPLAQIAAATLADGLAASTWVGGISGVPDTVVWMVVGLLAVSAIGIALCRLVGRPAVLTMVVFVALQAVQLGWAAVHRPMELDPLRMRLLERVGVTRTVDVQSSPEDPSSAD